MSRPHPVFAFLLSTLACGLGCSDRGHHSEEDVGRQVSNEKTGIPAPALQLDVSPKLPEDLLAEDVLVLETVLDDLFLWKDSAMVSNSTGKDIVVLAAETVEKSGMLSAGQLCADLEAHGYSVPDDAGVNLGQRNTKAVPLLGFKSRNSNVLVRDLEGIKSDFDFTVSYPRARCYVHAWLPGYSQDRRTAVLRFWIGPSPHGATGTYLLIKETDTWTVKWQHKRYYL